MVKAGTSLALAAATCLLAMPASAQELSDESVKKFMEYAWQMVPTQFTKPDGKTIQVDKKKKDEVVVPIETAREIIRVGRISAHAQICELKDDQLLNYNSLMRREMEKKKWSEQQMIYVNMLHLTTLMLLTGNIKVVEQSDGEKEVMVEESKKPAPTCSSEQRAKVKDLITAYVASGPKLNVVPAPPPGATGSTAPAPAPAEQKPAEKKK